MAALLSAVAIQVDFPKKITRTLLFSIFLFMRRELVPCPWWLWRVHSLVLEGQEHFLVGFVTSQVARAAVTPRPGVSQCC